MVRSIHKIKIASVSALAAAAPMLAFIAAPAPVKAENPQNVNFNVNVAEVLTVSITDPASWASGDLTNAGEGGTMVSDFLRNKVTVSAVTNNATGVTVSMHTPTGNTNLVNQSNNSQTIATLGSSTTAAAFPVNRWGYSLTDTAAGDTSATYNAVSDTATQIFTTVGTGNTSTGSQDVYFGAKANNNVQSGTYKQTVYFAAVTGTIDTGADPQNPLQPTNPSNPVPVDNTPTYVATTQPSGQTSYTRRTTSGSGTSPVTGATKTNTTEVSKGDTRSSYTQAAGVTNTSPSTIDGGSSLATALGVAAGVAAVSGLGFFVAAKRRKDEDEK